MSAHGLAIHEAGVSIRRPLVYGVLLAALLAATVASLALGAVKVPVHVVIDVLLGNEVSGPDQQIVETLRLPRTVEALCVGAALGVAGAILQGALANPLASPDVIGVTGGAGFGAILIIILFPGSIALLPLGALFFGLLAAALVFAIAWSGANRGSTGKVILAGIAVLSLFTAGTTGLLAAYPGESALGDLLHRRRPHFERLGGDGRRSGPTSRPASSPPLFLIRPLDRLALGDDVAGSLGSRPHLIRLGAAIAAALLAAASAAIAGLVGFLGLVVPHVVRMAGGTSSQAFVVPASAIGGAALLAAADTLARTLRAPIEMPVGPFMAILGVPLFLWLLRRAV